MEADATFERSRATVRINLGVSRSESRNASKRPRAGLNCDHLVSCPLSIWTQIGRAHV